MLSARARHEASMILKLTPTVLHVSSPEVESMRTRVLAAVPSWPSMMRTL